LAFDRDEALPERGANGGVVEHRFLIERLRLVAVHDDELRVLGDLQIQGLRFVAHDDDHAELRDHHAFLHRDALGVDEIG